MQEHVQESVHLPQECIRHILSFVGDGDYYSAMQVSKEWLSAARCEKLPFWRVVSLQKYRALSPHPASDVFCGCKVAAICRRYRRVLRTIDMRGCTTCQSCMLAYEFSRHKDDRVTPGYKLLFALAEDGGMPALESLVLADMPAPSRITDDIASVLCPGLRAGAAPPPPAPPFPRLRFLSFAGNRVFHGDVMAPLLDACPALREVHLGGCDVSDACLHALADAAASPARPPLRANCRDRQPLPEAIDVSCGMCDAVLLRDVRSYCYNMPSQGHISRECYTHASPAPGATAPLRASWAQGETQLNCPRNCHAPEQRYLIDRGSGNVNCHGWACAIALSEADAAPHPGDPAFLFSRLAIATPSAGAAAAAGGAATGEGVAAHNAAAAEDGAGGASAGAADAAAVAVGGMVIGGGGGMEDLWVGESGEEDGEDDEDDHDDSSDGGGSGEGSAAA